MKSFDEIVEEICIRAAAGWMGGGRAMGIEVGQRIFEGATCMAQVLEKEGLVFKPVASRSEIDPGQEVLSQETDEPDKIPF